MKSCFLDDRGLYSNATGVKDCSIGEDELDCEDFQCPGFYRCRDSIICLHPDHLCDGIKQCPLHEDEFTCGITCPPGCTCQGLEFTCVHAFPAQKFPTLRYIDASGSKMNLIDFQVNDKLISLNLAHCNISIIDIDHQEYPNLLYLDISYNEITYLPKQFFKIFRVLRILIIRHNPLVLKSDSVLVYIPFSLRKLDVSGVHQNNIWMDKFLNSSFTNLNILNISNSLLTSVASFRKLSNLEILDLQGNDIESFQRNVFTGLSKLSELYTDNPKLCCDDLLPDVPKSCFTHPDEISSCKNLLQSNLYRIFTWIFCVVSLSGNFLSLFSKLTSYKKSSHVGFNLLVINLCLSDALMGVYLAIIAIADLTMLGSYLWRDLYWRKSLACKVCIDHCSLDFFSSNMIFIMVFS